MCLALLKSVSDPHTSACMESPRLSIQNSNFWAPLLQNQNHGEARETTLGQVNPSDSDAIGLWTELTETLLSGVIWRGNQSTIIIIIRLVTKVISECYTEKEEPQRRTSHSFLFMAGSYFINSWRVLSK